MRDPALLLRDHAHTGLAHCPPAFLRAPRQGEQAVPFPLAFPQDPPGVETHHRHRTPSPVFNSSDGDILPSQVLFCRSVLHELRQSLRKYELRGSGLRGTGLCGPAVSRWTGLAKRRAHSIVASSKQPNAVVLVHVFVLVSGSGFPLHGFSEVAEIQDETQEEVCRILIWNPNTPGDRTAYQPSISSQSRSGDANAETFFG